MTAEYDEETDTWECDSCGWTWPDNYHSSFCDKCGTWNGRDD